MRRAIVVGLVCLFAVAAAPWSVSAEQGTVKKTAAAKADIAKAKKSKRAERPQEKAAQLQARIRRTLIALAELEAAEKPDKQRVAKLEKRLEQLRAQLPQQCPGTGGAGCATCPLRAEGKCPSSAAGDAKGPGCLGKGAGCATCPLRAEGKCPSDGASCATCPRRERGKCPANAKGNKSGVGCPGRGPGCGACGDCPRKGRACSAAAGCPGRGAGCGACGRGPGKGPGPKGAGPGRGPGAGRGAGRGPGRTAA
jgi:hypothetical protein